MVFGRGFSVDSKQEGVLSEALTRFVDDKSVTGGDSETKSLYDGCRGRRVLRFFHLPR